MFRTIGSAPLATGLALSLAAREDEESPSPDEAGVGFDLESRV